MARLNTKVLEKRISKLLQDRELLEKYRTVRQREKKLLARIEKLEEQNQKLGYLPPQRREQKKEELEAQFNETAASLTAIEWVSKGIAKWDGEDSKINRQAIDYFNEAIVFTGAEKSSSCSINALNSSFASRIFSIQSGEG